MAETRSAWGIDIGQAGLKAIKLRVEEDGVRAVAFDYIPHPKILSQPDAIPDELIKQSVETFVSRNKLGKDLIGISVSGQTSLAKFIKLPPVEPAKVAEIVKYEAKQQIPFDLNDVIWDYQTIGGGVEESGFMLEAEVGMFAMKRDLVFEAMKPLTAHKAEIDLVQVSPLAIYNYLSYDVLGFRLDEDKSEPPNAADYYIILDMGADNTTLMVSNGRNIWIRNVPIGGNHFTRALTREMKLTFAKAEHLKCNATKAPDPKAVFQAMRPVFNDYVTEIQRSIGYFGSVNRSAKIAKVIGVGNGFKMAGLQKFLQQNLQYEVQKLDDFQGVTGDSVLSDPLFIDNIMTFAVPYGLALQTLKQTRIHTTLLPPELVMQRAIRKKKPWAVGIAAGLLLTMGLSTFASARVLDSLSEVRWKDGQAAVDGLKSTVSSNTGAYGTTRSTHEANQAAIMQLTAPLRNRETWLELLKAVNVCLPREVGNEKDVADTTLRKQIHIESFSQKKVENVSEWHAALIAANKEEDFHEADRTDNPPDGLGYIVTLRGHHYYNNEKVDYHTIGVHFIQDTLVNALRQWKIDTGNGQKPTPVGQLGISHPIVVHYDNVPNVPDPRYSSSATSAVGAMRGGGMGEEYGMSEEYSGAGGLSGGGMPSLGAGGPGALTPLEELNVDKDEEEELVTRTDFVVQFAWVPVARDDRKEAPEGSEETPAAE